MPRSKRRTKTWISAGHLSLEEARDMVYEQMFDARMRPRPVKRPRSTLKQSEEQVLKSISAEWNKVRRAEEKLRDTLRRGELARAWWKRF